MRIIAPMMILIMMTSTLAGCTGGDPDSGGEMDTDAINDLIDQNLQDFINNTTITVNQEIHHHYYNNTTVNEGDLTNNAYNTEYNNTTVIEGGEVTNYDQSSSYYNASNGGNNVGIIHTIDFVFDLDFLWGNSPIVPGDRNSTYTTNWSYYDYATNDYRNDVFTFSCGIYYLVGNSSTNSSNLQTYWENNNWYDDAWSDNGYNNTMRDLFHSVAWNEDLRWVCDEDFYGYNDHDNRYSEIIFEFTIPEGFALMCIRGAYTTNPMVYTGVNYSTNGFDYTWSADSGQAAMVVDGVYWSCNNDRTTIGGEYDMLVQIGESHLYEDRDYRLIWSYQLVPVIPHDQTDLDD